MEPSNFTQPMILPLMNLNGGDDFNYARFLDDDIGYLASNESSTSLQALNNEFGASSASPPASAPAKAVLNQKQRLERRGHTKSRRGCYNCKRRRIKCQENRPACGHCVKTGLKCEYPAVPQVVHQPQNQVPLFSLQDMRFFQHFLFVCFPNHPIGNEAIWTHEVPCLSQNYDYLMHAILGLAASDLMLQDPSLVTFAMMHRLKAIKAIKKRLNEAHKSNNPEEGNAIVATCFALTFQSVILDDGMAEYMTFCRGIVLVAARTCAMHRDRFLFSNMGNNEPASLLRPFLENMPPVNSEWVDMAIASIRAIEPLVLLCREDSESTSTSNSCEERSEGMGVEEELRRGTGSGSASGSTSGETTGTVVEAEYYRFLIDMAEALYEPNPYHAYELLCAHYGWWIQLPHSRFRRLVDPTSQTATLLATHWIALKQIMWRVTSAEHRLRAQEPRDIPVVKPKKDGDGSNKDTHGNEKDEDGDILVDPGMARWLKYLNRQVDAEHRRYNDWPVWVQQQLDRDIRYFGKTRV
ncbi:uncharacterized protein F4822DRAFT_429385 [Hypoxylon trugodes]|uniref:uncharacterized protein n=1 Tax=Hypoxylon trugodes TaxID=326681 RepID=UPI00219CE90F|nr:uncharacterized protein F4822DRAFT_429385 [Hypoxylon trugodes]KAI1388770.1 hypothetical protein F4822DRAFT_429385 [Hypoxylon trugodes]